MSSRSPQSSEFPNAPRLLLTALRLLSYDRSISKYLTSVKQTQKIPQGSSLETAVDQHSGVQGEVVDRDSFRHNKQIQLKSKLAKSPLGKSQKLV